MDRLSMFATWNQKSNSACGASCGSGDKTAAACGSACGAGDKKASACGSD